MERLLEPKDVCERWRISINTLYQWTSKNKVRHLKVGGGLRFRESDIEQQEKDSVVGLSKLRLI